MPIQQAFKSAGQASVALTTADTSVATSTAIPGDGENIVILNLSGAAVTVNFGNSGSVAAAAGSPYVVANGERVICTVGRAGPLYAAAMPLATASGAVYFQRGDGMIH